MNGLQHANKIAYSYLFDGEGEKREEKREDFMMYFKLLVLIKELHRKVDLSNIQCFSKRPIYR